MEAHSTMLTQDTVKIDELLSGRINGDNGIYNVTYVLWSYKNIEPVVAKLFISYRKYTYVYILSSTQFLIAKMRRVPLVAT